MRQRYSSERGFTLIELLAVVGIMGILASMATLNYRLYTARAYGAQVDRAVQDIRTSIEAGKIGLSESGGFYSGWSMSAGPVSSWSGHNFLPGFMNRDGVVVFALYNAGCRGAGCLVSMGSASSCKSGKTKSFTEWADMPAIEWEWEGDPWC